MLTGGLGRPPGSARGPSEVGAPVTRRRVVGAHSPALHGLQIEAGLALLSELPTLAAAPLPGQAELEVLLAIITAAVPAA